jgi:hypothetical protein
VAHEQPRRSLTGTAARGLHHQISRNFRSSQLNDPWVRTTIATCTFRITCDHWFCFFSARIHRKYFWNFLSDSYFCRPHRANYHTACVYLLNAILPHIEGRSHWRILAL